MEEESLYNKQNPFFATIVERYHLTKPLSKKDTQHVVLSLKGSGLHYEVGDSLGIFPANSKLLVEKTLGAMQKTGQELIVDRHSGQMMLLKDFLTNKANITDLSHKFLKTLADMQTNEIKKAVLEDLINGSDREKLKNYLDNHELWDMLLANLEVEFNLQDLCNLLMPLLPRLYSISSAKQVVGEEVHLTVGVLKYSTNGHERVGVCTHFLCDLMPMHEAIVPVYIQKHHGFTVPQDSTTSIIMIGPGTGIAPFRAFMQERIATNATGKHWLFFGECNKATDYLYQDYWEDLENKQQLKLATAFSRDQEEKIYVQHRMLENGEELYNWLEEGCYLYVCGDASKMAKDVEATLLQIIEVHGQKTPQEAKDYVKTLRQQKRYLRDVY